MHTPKKRMQAGHITYKSTFALQRANYNDRIFRTTDNTKSLPCTLYCCCTITNININKINCVQAKQTNHSFWNPKSNAPVIIASMLHQILNFPDFLIFWIFPEFAGFTQGVQSRGILSEAVFWEIFVDQNFSIIIEIITSCGDTARFALNCLEMNQ